MGTSSLKRILLAEDDPDIRLIAQLALESIGGFQVRLCGSGGEALEAAPGFQPDLVLLDVMMPGMDGPATLQALRALPGLAATPVVFMTAKAQPQEIAQLKALGAFDVIVKPFEPMQLSARIASIWQHHLHSIVERQVSALTAEYIADLPDTLARIEQAWAMARQAGDSARFEQVLRLAHTIRGTGGTLRLHALSEAARRIEATLAPLRAAPAASGQQIAEIDELLLALRRAAAAPNGDPIHPAAPSGPQLRRPSLSLKRPALIGGAAKSRAIVLAELDPALASEFAAQLSYFGYTAHIAAIADLRARIERIAPIAIITDVRALRPGEAHDDRLLSLRRKDALAPAIIILSDDGNLDTRLRAVRAGSDAFFTKPVTTSALIDKLDHFITRYDAEPIRVLVVDDDPILATHYAAVLQAAGMLTEVVTDPLQVMRPLVDFRPDLILMDMYMPNCDGTTLAAVIRQQEDYVGIPIVYLSAETNRDMQLAAMELGADDFMAKPILPEHLISAVTNRAERSRTLRSLMIRDSLTGLYNHTTTKERLEAELNRARRDVRPLALALLDLDHFKQVNDTYGHPTGDWVLKSLARLLQQRLRRNDIIGRYGGEEFAVVLPDTDAAAAAKVLDDIRAGLSHVRQRSGQHEFTVTFSAGVASFPEYPEAIQLTNAADQALYAAKHAGRDRVVLAGSLTRWRPSDRL